MKITQIIMLFVLCSSYSLALKSKLPALRIEIQNIASDDGKILLSVHNATNFMRQTAIVQAEKEAKEGKMNFKFTQLPMGIYSILVLHDTNANYRMDFFDNGRPKEAFATSGKANPYGPPRFEETKFEFKKDTLIRLSF